MNTLIRTILMTLLLFSITACSEQEPVQTVTADIEVSISTNPHWGTLAVSYTHLRAHETN